MVRSAEDRRTSGVAADRLGRNCIFSVNSERPPIIIGLRDQPPVLAVGGDVYICAHTCDVGKKSLLAGSLVARQRTRLISDAAAGANSDSLQRTNIRLLERMREKARSNIFMVIDPDIRVATSIVLHSIEDTGLIIEHASEELTVQLQAHVSVGRELAGQTALGENEIGARLKALEANRRFELARLNLEFRPVVDIQIGVLQEPIVQ